jgi:fucose 4-O-acetylase-like acetyltransferase
MSNADAEERPPGGLWARAVFLADRTPEARNRYVDFLRGLSILVVVVGHWTIAAPFLDGGSPRYEHLLDLEPWSRWLTWLFQVMPVFFFVGGFSNCTSWRSAQRRHLGYHAWLDARLRRLIGPVMPLLVAWAVMAAVAHSNGVSAEMIRIGSQVALVPIWFLAVYMLVVVMVPVTHAAWQRWGVLSIVVPVVAAAIVDLGFFAGYLSALSWVNYLFVWLAVHQLGYAWHDERMKGPRIGLPSFVAGLGALVALTHLGPYPLSLVGVPSEEISNTLPPKLPLLALAAAQVGLLISLEAPARRWLARRVPWAATILINGMIMTIFLWHSTVMMLLIGLAFWQLPALLSPQPGTAFWWWMRPLWILAYAVLSLPFLLGFARFERPEGSAPGPVAAWRQLVGCGVACAGLAYLALDGVGGDGWLGLRWIPLLLPFVGAGLAGFGPLGRLRRT